MKDFLNFPDPHCHPASFDSGSTPENMAKREVELGTNTLTCTDHGTLASSRLIYRLAKKRKLRPILGLEAYFRDDDCPILSKHGIVKQPETQKSDSKLSVSHYAKYYHLTMHALDQEGFEAIVKTISASNEHSERHGIESKPIFTWSNLEELGSKNITFGSSCLIGMVQRHLLNNQPKLAVDYYEKLRGLAKPGNFFVEAFPHDCGKNWVKAVFLRFGPSENGICEDDRNYHFGKWLRIRWNNGIEDIRATDLAERWIKWLEGKKAMPKIELIAIKHYHSWINEIEPLPINDAKIVEDFIQNECRPWCPDGDVQKGANRFLMMLAKKYKDPILISNDSHFAYPDDKIVQDVRLFSMESDKTKGNTAKWRFYGSYHRQTSEEAFGHFNKTLDVDRSQMQEWIQNNIDWSNRFGWEFKDKISLPAKFYPENTLKRTMEIVKQVGRMDWSNQIRRDRLAAEIKMLHKNGIVDLLPYFFLDYEVVERYEKNGQLTGVGRGSAAGLSLAYYMGITHVDPIKYGLSKERFLTESRVKSGKRPDIDQDLPSLDLLINPADPQKGWLQERFAGHVARISTNSTLRLRSTAQDVSRVLHGHVLPEISNLTKRFPKVPQGIKDYDFVFGYNDADNNLIEGASTTDSALKEYINKFPTEWNIVSKALGITRQKSSHACGFVISNEPIANFIPTTVLSDGTRITEYVNSGEDPSIEDAGGVKMDFLQLNTLRDIQDAIKLIHQRQGYIPKDESVDGLRVPGIRIIPLSKDGVTELYDVWKLPEDQAVFKNICFGNTATVFQFSTPIAKQLLKCFVSNNNHTLRSIEHISAFTALGRPGGLNAHVEEGDLRRNMLEEFAARSKKEKSIGNIPILDKILPETFGIVVFQEQCQKVFETIGHTTAEQGDEFRVHISKKKMAEVYKDKAIFMPGANQTAGNQQAELIWGQIEKMAGYGFNKSHAVCYATIGYACAWIKHYYPLEWWTSCLRNTDRKTIDSKFWVYCKKYILTPDIQLSQDDFSIENNSIRAPLRLLTGVGERAHAELVEGRPYKDIRDFIQRIYNKKVAARITVEKIIKKRILKRDQTSNGPTYIETKVNEFKLGRSSINKTVILKLIISGSIDSLFPLSAKSIFDKLSIFAETWADVHGLRKKDGTLKIEPVDRHFNNLTAANIFLLKKSILSSYSADLVSMMKATNDDIVGSEDNYAWNMPRKFEGNGYAPLVSGDIAKAITEDQNDLNFPDKFKFGVVAYINECESFWNGQAIKVSFEVDGERLTAIKWPTYKEDENGQKRAIPPKIPDHFKGSISILTMVRWNVGKSFSLDDIVVLEKPFSIKEEE